MQIFVAGLFSIFGFNISWSFPPGPSPPSPRPIECFRCVLFHLKIFCHQMIRIITEGWLPLIRQQLETMTSRSVLFKNLIHPCRGRKGELFLIFLIGGIAIDLNAGPRGEISVLDSMDSVFYNSVAFTLKENLILSLLQ